MRFMSNVIVLLCFALLSGCALQDYKVERSTKRCESYGYERGDPEMKQCIAQDRASRRAKAVYNY